MKRSLTQSMLEILRALRDDHTVEFIYSAYGTTPSHWRDEESGKCWSTGIVDIMRSEYLVGDGTSTGIHELYMLPSGDQSLREAEAQLAAPHIGQHVSGTYWRIPFFGTVVRLSPVLVVVNMGRPVLIPTGYDYYTNTADCHAFTIGEPGLVWTVTSDS